MPRIGSIASNLPVPLGAGRRFTPAVLPPPALFIGQLMSRRQRPSGTLLTALRTYDAGGRLKLLRLPPGYTLDIEI